MSFLYPFLQWGNLFPYPPGGNKLIPLPPGGTHFLTPPGEKSTNGKHIYSGAVTQMQVGRVREHISNRSAQPEGLDPPPTYSNGTADLLGSNAPHESKCISAEGRYALADYSSLGET